MDPSFLGFNLTKLHDNTEIHWLHFTISFHNQFISNKPELHNFFRAHILLQKDCSLHSLGLALFAMACTE